MIVFNHLNPGVPRTVALCP